jgi:hypothetical protein
VALVSVAGLGCLGSDAPSTVTSTITTFGTATEMVDSTETTDSGNQRKDGESGLVFRGQGDRRLPPIRIDKGGSVLRWQNRGEVFSLFGRNETVVDSVAGKGTAFLRQGLHMMDVIASGSWIVAIPSGKRAR